MGESVSAEKKYNLVYYCILYLDVLGQSHLLDQLERLPETQEEEAHANEILNQTANFLEHLREWFKDFFEVHAAESDWIATLPNDKRNAMGKMLETHVDMHFFSDSIQISVSLLDDGSEQSTQMNGVTAAMLAGCGMHLLSLSVGKATRGGIDVGWALKMDTGEIYGASLAHAVRLEQKDAKYPRIVVGDGLRNYLRWVQEYPFKSIFGLSAQRAAEAAERLIFKDVDGVHALDFMGSEMKQTSRDAFDSDVIESVLSFVEQERTRFRSENNHKLADRYDALWKYVTSRADIWGVDS